MSLRATLLSLLLLPLGCGDDSSDGGDGDSDADTDTDTGTGDAVDCASGCNAENERCGAGTEECMESCQAAATVDVDGWLECLNALSPPCGSEIVPDENCCLAAGSCRTF